MVISMNFRLQDIRENMELSQKEVEIIPLNKLILLANYYGISLDYICNLSNIKKESKAYNYKVDKKISGNNIVTFRKEKNLTQKELALFLNTTPSTVCAYEKGKTLILTSFAYQICKRYNVSMDYICGITKD